MSKHPQGPDLAWWARQLRPDRMASGHIWHALDMIQRLPRYASSSPVIDNLTVRVACLESFLVNVRLVSEFFTRPSDKRDWRAQDFWTDWDPTSSEVKADLDELWVRASQHVAHLSKMRTPEDVSDITHFDTSLEALERISLTCFAIVREYVQQVSNAINSSGDQAIYREKVKESVLGNAPEPDTIGLIEALKGFIDP